MTDINENMCHQFRKNVFLKWEMYYMNMHEYMNIIYEYYILYINIMNNQSIF